MIRLELQGLPPSANHAYFNLPKGGRTLSTKGKKYIAETKAHFAQKHAKEMMFFKKHVPYLVFIRFYMEAVENLGWKTGTAQNRYKAVDVTNRVKLLEDCLKDAAGIDDAQNIRVVLDKQQGKERTIIWVFDLENEETPFDHGFNLI